MPMAVAAILVQNDDKEANARDIFASNLGPEPWSIPFCLFCLFFFASLFLTRVNVHEIRI
jgi:hypothetical protein